MRGCIVHTDRVVPVDQVRVAREVRPAQQAVLPGGQVDVEVAEGVVVTSVAVPDHGAGWVAEGPAGRALEQAVRTVRVEYYLQTTERQGL